MTADLRVSEEPHLLLGDGLLGGTRMNCGDKQSTEFLSLDIINSTNCYLEGREKGGGKGRDRGKETRRLGEEKEGGGEGNFINKIISAITCVSENAVAFSIGMAKEISNLPY